MGNGPTTSASSFIESGSGLNCILNSCRQPDLLARCVVRGRNAVVIVNPLVDSDKPWRVWPIFLGLEKGMLGMVLFDPENLIVLGGGITEEDAAVGNPRKCELCVVRGATVLLIKTLVILHLIAGRWCGPVQNCPLSRFHLDVSNVDEEPLKRHFGGKKLTFFCLAKKHLQKTHFTCCTCYCLNFKINTRAVYWREPGDHTS